MRMNKLELLLCVFGDMISNEMLKKYLPNVDDTLSTLDEKEQYVLNKRFSGITLKQTGIDMINVTGSGVSTERVRQIEAKAIRKLRHPFRVKILKGEITLQQYSEKKERVISPELEAESKRFSNLTIDRLLENYSYWRLSKRTKRCLQDLKIDNVGKLILTTEKEILGIRGIGRKTLCEIKDLLYSKGLKLRKI